MQENILRNTTSWFGEHVLHVTLPESKCISKKKSWFGEYDTYVTPPTSKYIPIQVNERTCLTFIAENTFV